MASFSCREKRPSFIEAFITILVENCNEGGVGIFVSVTNGQTDGWTYTFLKSPRHTDSNGI